MIQGAVDRISDLTGSEYQLVLYSREETGRLLCDMIGMIDGKAPEGVNKYDLLILKGIPARTAVELLDLHGIKLSTDYKR